MGITRRPLDFRCIRLLRARVRPEGKPYRVAPGKGSKNESIERLRQDHGAIRRIRQLSNVAVFGVRQRDRIGRR